jgi:hypothetical protein
MWWVARSAKLQPQFARGSHEEFGAGVETAHLDRGIQLLRKGANDPHPEPWCTADLEVRREPVTCVAHRKFDHIVVTTREANPNGTTLLVLIRVFRRIGYQLIGHEGDRDCPIGHDINARLGGDFDTAKRDGFVQIVTNVPDIDAEIEPVQAAALLDAFVCLCNR